MITFTCQCGHILNVGTTWRGRRCRCPQCGEFIRVPGEVPPPRVPAHPQAPVEQRAANLPEAAVEQEAALQATPPQDAGPAASVDPLVPLEGSLTTFPSPSLIAGILIVVTFVLPWYTGTTVMMSWHMIQQSPHTGALFLVVAWLIGLALVVISAVVRGLPLAVCCAALGLIGLLLYGLVKMIGGDSMGLFRETESFTGVTWSLGLCLTGAAARVAVIVINHLRRELGPSTRMRIVQIAAGALLLMLVAANIIGFLADVDASAGDLVVSLLTGLAIVFAGGLTMIDGCLGKESPSPSEVALLLLYAATAGQIGFFVVRPAVVAGQAGIGWYHFNSMAMVGALAVATGYGAYRLAREASGMALSARDV